MLIAHLTDLHIRPRGVPAYRVAETNKMVERAIDAVRRMLPKPDCVIISGDLTDCGLVEEYELLRGLLARLDMPVYLIPGNHDRRDNFKKVLGEFHGVNDDPTYIRFTVDGGPVRLVALDTIVPGKSEGALHDDQLKWLEATLEADNETPTIVFMHHPPFDCGIDHMDRIRLLKGVDEFAHIIAANPQVERVLCGHHHRPIHMLWAGTICSTGPSVAHQVQLDLEGGEPGGLVFEPTAFQIHKWIEGTGLVTHHAYVERFDGPYPFVLDASYPGIS